MEKFSIALISIILIACSSDNNSKKINTITINRKIESVPILFSDSLRTWSLNDSQILKLPFQVDSSYVVPEFCGNAPKCKRYKRKRGNVTLTFCQNYIHTELEARKKNETDYKKEFEKN